MSDPTHNPPDEESWPPVEVLLGWVHDLGVFQMGFSLSPAWQPPPELARRVDRSNYLTTLRKLNFPEKLESWLLEQFFARRITMISVVRFQNRWRVHIGLSLHYYEVAELAELVDNLAATALLPKGGEGQHVAEMEKIGRDHPDYTEQDIRYHWLGDRIRTAVQALFEARKSGS
jgi:hypothetical protein